MKKRFLTLLVCFCSVIVFSQNKSFEKGYFIDKNNKKVDCLIKNEQWDYNPTEFEYKKDENSAIQTIKISDFNEFNVGGEYKYIKANVKIDKSNDNKRDRVTAIKAMNFVDDVLLLRVRIEGKATLYSYANADYTRFFYRLDSGQITPLSYKIYYDRQEYESVKNETYKQELLNALKCESITQSTINNLDYTISSLTDFFVEFNKCSGSKTEEFAVKKNYKSFELYLAAGVGITSFSASTSSTDMDFSKKSTLKLGLHTEINLSTKVKNWSVLFEAVYFKYSNSHKYGSSSFDVNFDYGSINFSIGLRKHFILNQKSSVFIDGYATYEYPIDSASKNDFGRVVTGSFGPALGLGYVYDTKYLIELRYDLPRNVIANSDSKLSTIGCMLGYKFL